MQGDNKDPGIIPRAVKRVLEQARLVQQNQVGVTISYFEIYNEKVFDLMDTTKQDLPIRENEHRKIVIPGLTEVRKSWGCPSPILTVIATEPD